MAHGLEDYYTGRCEVPGRWLGAAASGLDLGGGSVDGDDLRAVLAGLRPGTGQSPNGGPPTVFKNRVPGFDVTFAAPKSVSVLYGLGDPLVQSAVVAAHDAAVDAAVAWLEREACFVRRGSNNRAAATGPSIEFGTRRLPGVGFVAAGFRHRTSRAGDPHLHTHVLVANMTCGPDGRWSALDATELYRSKRTAGAVFRSALADGLCERLGVTWRPSGKGLIEVAGIPADVLAVFSKRRSQIEAAMAADGSEGAAAAAEAMLATRTAKAEVDPASLREVWAGEAAAAGFGPEQLDALLAHRSPLAEDAELVVRLPDPITEELVEQQVRSAAFGAWVGERMAVIDSTCTRHQVTEIIASSVPGLLVRSLEEVTAWVLAQPELIPVAAPPATPHPQAGWEQRWTSQRLLTIEHELGQVIDDRTAVQSAVPAAAVEQVIAGSGLGSDQANAVRLLAGSQRAVSLLVGRAGTGKTYTVAAIRRALQDHAGRRLVGVAPSARAARELADGAGIEAFTFPRFHLHCAATLSSNDVVVIDEAAMAGTVDLHRVISRVRHVGARVILVGDHHQLPEIGAGGTFAVAVENPGTEVAELTINRRQRAGWEHAALDQLRHGNPLAGFRAYHDHGRVTVAATVTEVHALAVTAWLAAHRHGIDAIVLAGTRTEATALNRLARHHVHGELSGPVLQLRGRQFQAGDRVILLSNSAPSDGHLDLGTGRPARIDNGMIGTIRTIGASGDVDVELVNGRRLRIAAGYVCAGHVDHGYATTIHKAQGLTCDRMFLVGPNGLYREAVYVAMSRARDGSYLYATAGQVAELVERPHSHGIPLPDEHIDEPDRDLTRAVATSRAKTWASRHHPLLQAITRCAGEHSLDWLWDRHVACRHAAAELVAAGLTDPTQAHLRFERARHHRRYLTAGTRVHAADWDNVGTVTSVHDDTGTAAVTFTSRHGRTTSKLLHWADLTPIDHPEPVELTAAAGYFVHSQQTVDDHAAAWHHALTDRGIHSDELQILPQAIAMRRQRLAHHLAGDPPRWLTYWYGPRPLDPVGAQVWDDEITQLAAWRDARHLPPDTPGYGPRPTDQRLLARWHDHLDRSLETRCWLTEHSPTLPAPPPPIVDIAAVRARLGELDAILADAPPDQTRIIDAIRTGQLSPGDVDQALRDTATAQHQRRQWILEHWPHVVEHAELTRISNHHDPLAHWPTAIPPNVQAWLDRLATISVDTPEAATLNELDDQLAHTQPAAITARLEAKQAQLNQRLTIVDTALPHADHDQRVFLEQHRHRLTARIHQTATQINGHAARVALWEWGDRPDHLTTTIARRANHLSHTAITEPQQWLITTIADWHYHHPHGTLYDLHHTLTDIAAYRERAGHNTPNPLGPTHPDQHLETRRAELEHRLHHAPTPIIGDHLTR